MTHIHICPTEISIFMMTLDYLQVYLFHYKHIFMSLFSKGSSEGCDLCE